MSGLLPDCLVARINRNRQHNTDIESIPAIRNQVADLRDRIDAQTTKIDKIDRLIDVIMPRGRSEIEFIKNPWAEGVLPGPEAVQTLTATPAF